jgi:hypothetical protein
MKILSFQRTLLCFGPQGTCIITFKRFYIYIYIYIYIYNLFIFPSKDLTSLGSFIENFLEIHYKNGHSIAKNRYVNVIIL